MLVMLPTVNGWVPINPKYITHLTSSGNGGCWTTVHIDSGSSGDIAVVLGDKITLARLLNDPDLYDFFRHLSGMPAGFPEPNRHSKGDWLNREWLIAQWENDLYGAPLADLAPHVAHNRSLPDHDDGYGAVSGADPEDWRPAGDGVMRRDFTPPVETDEGAGLIPADFIPEPMNEHLLDDDPSPPDNDPTTRFLEDLAGDLVGDVATVLNEHVAAAEGGMVEDITTDGDVLTIRFADGVTLTLNATTEVVPRCETGT